MRIAYISSYYSTPKYGPTRIAQHLRDYYRGKLKFTFITDDNLLNIGREVKVFGPSFISFLPGYWIIKSWLYYKTYISRKNLFDLVICSNAYEAFFFAVFKVPVIVLFNDDNAIWAKNHFNKIRRQHGLFKGFSRLLGFYIEKFVGKNATEIWCCSEYLREAVIGNYNFSKDKVKVLFPAVDNSIFVPRQKKNADKFTIFYMKRDWERGGLTLLVSALSQIGNEELCLIVAGVPERERKKVQKIIAKSDIKFEVNFAGAIELDEVKDYLYQSNLYVLPSYQEAFGISLLEAMATGTPVIASNVGGIPEVLDYGKAGLLFSPGDAKQLAELIQKQHATIVNHNEKIENGLKQVKKFDKVIFFKKVEELCFKLKDSQQGD